MATKSGKIDEFFDFDALTKEVNQVKKAIGELSTLTVKIAASGSAVSGSSSISEQKANQATLNKLTEESTKKVKELTEAELKLRDAQKEKAKQEKTNRDANNAMLTFTSRAIALEKQLADRYKETARQFGITSKAAREALKDYKELHKQTIAIDRSMGNFRDNVGNYASALAGFGGAAGKAGDVINNVTQKLSASPWMLVAAVVVSAAASMVASLKSVDSASDKIAETWEGMTRVGAVLTDRLANMTIGLGKFIMGDFKQGIDQISESFNGLGDAMSRASIAGERYAQTMDMIDESNTQFIGQEARLRNEAAKLIEVYQDNTKSAAVRKSALSQAMDYEKQIYAFKKSMAEKTYQAKLQAAEGETGISTKILDWIVKNDRATVLNKSKTNDAVRRAYEKLYGKDGALAKVLQDANAAVLNADSEEFEGKKKAFAKLSNFDKEIAAEAKKQQDGAAKLRLETSKKSLAELWDIQLQQIKKEDGFKALNEKEQNDLILKRRKDFLDEQFKQVQESVKQMKSWLVDITGGTGAITIPMMVMRSTGPGQAPDKMEKIDNSSEPPKGKKEEDPQEDLFGNELSQADLDLMKEMEIWNKRIQLVSNALSIIDNLIAQSYANRFAMIDAEATKDQEAKDKELKAAQGNDSKTKEINARYDAKEKEREKEKRRVQREQAKYQKTSGIIGAIINTALGVTAQFQAGPIIGVILGALVLAAGIAEIALIASQPLPSYAKGRKGGKAEMANVGEQGRELIVTKSGEMILTPASTTSTFLPEGSSVIPHDQLLDIAGRSASFMPTYQNSTYNDRIENEIRGLHSGFKMLKTTIENKTEHNWYFERGELHHMMKNGNTYTEWINKNVMP